MPKPTTLTYFENLVLRDIAERGKDFHLNKSLGRELHALHRKNLIKDLKMGLGKTTYFAKMTSKGKRVVCKNNPWIKICKR